MESVHLIGAEDVRSAGNSIRGAAQVIGKAAISIDETFRLFLDRFERLVERLEALHEENES